MRLARWPEAAIPVTPNHPPSALPCLPAAAELWTALIDRVAASRDSLSPRQMAAVMWAVAKTARWLPRVMSIGARHLAAHLEDYRTVDIVGMLWACAQLGGTLPGALPAAAAAALPSRGTALSLSCRNGHLGTSTFHACVPHAMLATPPAPPLLMLMHMCAELPPVLPAADGTLVPAVQRLTPQELQRCSASALCNLVWALGKLVAVRTGAERVRSASAPGRKAVGAAGWLMSAAGMEVQAASLAATSELAQRARQLNAHELSSAAVALAAHSAHPTLLPAHAVAAIQGACSAVAASDVFDAADLANLTIAAARLHWDDPPLLRSLADGLAPRVGVLLQPGEVARALACLAPGRYGLLFASLLNAHVARLKQRDLMYYSTVAELEERSSALVAFAVVGQAQGEFDALLACQSRALALCSCCWRVAFGGASTPPTAASAPLCACLLPWMQACLMRLFETCLTLLRLAT